MILTGSSILYRGNCLQLLVVVLLLLDVQPLLVVPRLLSRLRIGLPENIVGYDSLVEPSVAW